MEGSFDERYQKKERLRKRKEFKHALEHRGVKGRYCILHKVPNQVGWVRFGVTVSRSVGNAVTRNRVKRLLREVFRRNKNHVQDDADILIRARPAIRDASYQDIEQDILTIYHRFKH